MVEETEENRPGEEEDGKPSSDGLRPSESVKDLFSKEATQADVDKIFEATRLKMKDMAVERRGSPDKVVAQRFQSLLGTLKAAKKRGLLDFDGDVLFTGDEENEECLGLLSSEVSPLGDVFEEQPTTAEGSEKGTCSSDPGGDKADYEASSPSRPSQARSLLEGPAPPEDAASGKWQVDTSYLEQRLAAKPRREARKSFVGGAPASSTIDEMNEIASASAKRAPDGKWKVDTSYMQNRLASSGSSVTNLQKVSGAAQLAEGACEDRDAEAAAEYSDPATTKHAYDVIKGSSRPEDVDPSRKEQYLAEDEFKEVFGMSSRAFGDLPKWKRQTLKKAKELF